MVRANQLERLEVHNGVDVFLHGVVENFAQTLHVPAGDEFAQRIAQAVGLLLIRAAHVEQQRGVGGTECGGAGEETPVEERA